ncbi:MAG: ubiquinol-cytochrome C chaperone family protein [Pseudomonadota bacterium]
MPFLKRLFKREDPERASAVKIAGAIMSAAREPELYLRGFAADDFDGRFQMVALHGGLVMRRLKAFGTPGLVVSEKLGEVLFDRFDYAYREEGVGDASIARKVRKLGERYFGLARALDGALEGGDDLSEVLRRNGLGGSDVDGLAAHTRKIDDVLSSAGETELYAGDLSWPTV